MREKNQKGTTIEREIEKVRAQTWAKIQRSHAIDYIVLILGLGAVLFLLWFFQWMGLY